MVYCAQGTYGEVIIVSYTHIILSVELNFVF